jgi:hypothetical protein
MMEQQSRTRPRSVGQCPLLHSVSTVTDSLKERKVDISDPDIDVVGVDCIWHNMDVTNPNAFVTFRKWITEDVDALVQRVAGHVQQGLYSLISMQVSKHSLVVICVCSKAIEDFPEGAFRG